MAIQRFGRAVAVVGLQYGSEGKGAIASYLAPAASAAVRIGAANAGHTVLYKDMPYVMRQIPCAWTNPVTKLVLGITSFISLPVLLDEIERIDAITPIRDRLYIDPHAVVITKEQIRREMESGLAERISSTSAKSGLGIGTAMADKVLRSADLLRAQDVPELQPYLSDTVELINTELEDDQLVLLEGTQGFGLSVDHGQYPYVTGRDTTAASLFAGVGINPYPFDVEVIGVVRAYPIRVGGESGPFDPDSTEITWGDIAKRSESKRDLTERTSVTKTVRRVATFSWLGFSRSCMVNRPQQIALTFADHLDASVYEQEELSPKVYNFIEQLEEVAGAEVTLVKTGPSATVDFDPYRRSILRRLG